MINRSTVRIPPIFPPLWDANEKLKESRKGKKSPYVRKSSCLTASNGKFSYSQVFYVYSAKYTRVYAVVRMYVYFSVLLTNRNAPGIIVLYRGRAKGLMEIAHRC